MSQRKINETVPQGRDLAQMKDGGTKISFENLEKICDILGTDVGNLCLSKQERPECKKLVADTLGLFKPSSIQGRKNEANASFFFACFDSKWEKDDLVARTAGAAQGGA